ncbi:uncharacterized protein LOC134038078 [Osmerus eperlanus]
MASKEDAEDAHLRELLKQGQAYAKDLNPEPAKNKKRTTKNRFRISWRKRDVRGALVPQTTKCRSSTAPRAGTKKRKDTVSNTQDLVEDRDHQESVLYSLLQAVKEMLLDGQPAAPECEKHTEAQDWGIRNACSAERWKVSRPHLINSMLSDEAVLPTTCQWCRQGVAVMRCSECLPHQYLCMACDKEQHTRHVLHNRRSLI